MQQYIRGSFVIIFLFFISFVCFGQYGAPDPNSVGTGIQNTVVGTNAGNPTGAGFSNSIFGTDAGSSMTTGGFNSFFGRFAGGNSDGSNNSFFGVNAGARSVNGGFNVYFGSSAGQNSVNGSGNSFYGTNAGFFIEGNRNICIGNDSGPPFSSASGTPFPTAQVSDRLYIDVEGTDDPLIYGEFDNNFVRINGTFEVTAGLSNPSDKNLKKNFNSVDEAIILEKLVALPIQRWTYKDREDELHIGATAQDFYQAFGLGADNKHISTIDADGVAIAAIKALKNENDVIKQENNKLLNRLQLQEILLKELLQRVEQLEE